MQAEDLIELGAFVAVHQAQLMNDGAALERSDLDEYWVASKCRLDRWTRVLREIQTTHGSQLSPPVSRPTIVEVLTGEMLTRVWGALLCAHDEQTRTSQATSIARSVFQGHLEARSRVLGFLARGPEISLAYRRQLDRLRRRSERWADILLAHTGSPAFISDFAVDATRAMRYARDFRSRQDPPEQLWPRLQSSLRLAFHEEFGKPSRNADLNRRIASSVLVSFSSPLVASLRLPPSLWLERVQRLAIDSEQLIDRLLSRES